MWERRQNNVRCKDGEQARLFGAFNLKIDMANGHMCLCIAWNPSEPTM